MVYTQLFTCHYTTPGHLPTRARQGNTYLKAVWSAEFINHLDAVLGAKLLLVPQVVLLASLLLAGCQRTAGWGFVTL